MFDFSVMKSSFCFPYVEFIAIPATDPNTVTVTFENISVFLCLVYQTSKFIIKTRWLTMFITAVCVLFLNVLTLLYSICSTTMPQSASYFQFFRIKLEFRNVGFFGDRKPNYPEKTLEAATRPNNKLNPCYFGVCGVASGRFEPGTHQWQASDLTTAIGLLYAHTNFKL